VLTVPGDTLLGASAGASNGKAHSSWRRTVGLASASGCLYLAGMALNDYADRYVDAVERPDRPIPSGRVDPRFALVLSTGLTGAGVALAGATGGRRALRIAVPLTGVVWAYDLALKQTPLGPFTMAAARTLDVLMGAEGAGRAVPAACVVGAHTLTVSFVSRKEVPGSGRGLPAAALLAFCGVAAAAGRLAARSRRAGLASLAALGVYVGSLASAGTRAIRDPQPARLRALVGTGVRALMPLEAALLVGAGRIGPAAAVGGAWPLARWLSRGRSIT
jgi:4-hydroxybenzoate polyprenyltransferase